MEKLDPLCHLPVQPFDSSESSLIIERTLMYDVEWYTKTQYKHLRIKPGKRRFKLHVLLPVLPQPLQYGDVDPSSLYFSEPRKFFELPEPKQNLGTGKTDVLYTAPSKSILHQLLLSIKYSLVV